MSTTAWRVVQVLFISGVVIYSFSTGDYGYLGFVLGILAGFAAGVRLGRLSISTGFFVALAAALLVVSAGVGLLLPFLPQIVGAALFVVGFFTAFQMFLTRYGIGGGGRQRAD